MLEDVSPKIGEKLSNGATLIAKIKVAALKDENEYVVMGMHVYPNDKAIPVEYITWRMQANAVLYDTFYGEYFHGEKGIIKATESFVTRAGLRSHVE
jgi:hypothetical protein